MVRRVYVEKKPSFAVQAKDLRHEIRHYLNIAGCEDVRVFIRYDVENISDEVFEQAAVCVFSEPPVDRIYFEKLPEAEDAHVFSVEYLPGQFDQRADSAEQCIRFLDEREDPTVRSATTYMILGDITEEELAERDLLRREYIAEWRLGAMQVLENTWVQTPDGKKHKLTDLKKKK